MKCVICKQGETQDGTATLTLERDSLTLVVKGVPARVCTICGEEHLDDRTTSRLLESAEQAAGSGVHVEIREYSVA